MLPNTINHVVFDTANILLTFPTMKLRTSQTPTDELLQSLSHTLDKWLPTYKPEMNMEGNRVEIQNSLQNSPIDINERKNLRISLKIFLTSYKSESVKDAIKEALKRLMVKSVDTVLISFPTADHTLLEIMPIWRELEKLVEEGLINAIGVCDLDSVELTQLYDEAQIKPTVNQVNLESCCIMPVELTSFAKANNIQLLTHSDPRVILPLEDAPKMMKGLIEPDDFSYWGINWVVRFSVTIKSRGILQSNGYFVSAVKSTPQ